MEPDPLAAGLAGTRLERAPAKEGFLTEPTPYHFAAQVDVAKSQAGCVGAGRGWGRPTRAGNESVDDSVDVTGADWRKRGTHRGVPDRSGDSLAAELEQQPILLYREPKTDRQLLSHHAPEEAGAHDDAPTMLALGSLSAAIGRIGSILVAGNNLCQSVHLSRYLAGYNVRCDRTQVTNAEGGAHVLDA